MSNELVAYNQKLVEVKVLLNPAKPASVVRTFFAEGLSLAEMIGPNPRDTIEVRIDGELIPKSEWALTFPSEKSNVFIIAYPQGKWIAAIVVIIIGIIVGIYTGYWGILIMGIKMALTAALTPKPKQKNPNAGSGNALLGFTGTSNQIVPFGPIPIVLGHVEFFPPLAADAYTEVAGNDSWVRMLLDIGYGTPIVGEIYVGNTPISDLTDVEYQVGTGTLSLFATSVFENTLQLDASTDGFQTIKTLNSVADEASLDVTFPSGLFGMDTSGNTKGATLLFDIEYSISGANIWASVTALSGITISTDQCTVNGSDFKVYSKSRDPFRVSVRWKMPDNVNLYDIRFTRKSTTWDSGTDGNSEIKTMELTTLRTIREISPSNTGTTKLALRFKATDQTNSTVQQIRVEVTQQVPVYDSVAKTWTTKASSSPSWNAYWVMTGCASVQRLLTASQVDLTAHVNFDSWCTSNGFTFDGVLDSQQTMLDTLTEIYYAGRGSYRDNDGLFSVTWDAEQTVPVDYYTTFNMGQFTATKNFSTLPHALKVNFVNPEANWQQDQMIVLADGYSWDFGSGRVDAHGNASALPVATIFETLDLKGVTTPAAAWKHGRYDLAVQYFRQTVYTGIADVQNLRVQRGDMIAVQQDFLGLALGAGYVIAISADNLTYTTDEHIPYTANLLMQVRRQSDGSGAQYSVTAVDDGAGQTTANQFTMAAAPSPAIQVGDIVIIGNTATVQKNMLVTQVAPKEDLQAELTMLDADPNVWTYDSGAMPPFVSGITHAIYEIPPDPPWGLVVQSAQQTSTRNDGGTTGTRVTGLSGGGGGNLGIHPIYRF